MSLPPTPIGHLPLAEQFGPTVQGEGPSLGRSAYFVRLGGCNLTCQRCDTPYTWDASRYDLRAEITPTGVADILAAIPDDAWLVVVTGGEPMLYQRTPALYLLLRTLGKRGADVEIETNGTIAPGAEFIGLPHVRWNVSPKLDGPMSVDPEHRRIVPAALDAFGALSHQGRAALKVVCAAPADVDAAVALADASGWSRRHVWVMPAANTEAEVLDNGRAIADAAVAHRINVTTRLHMLLWPKIDRGR